MGAPVGSWRWQGQLLGMTVLGGIVGVASLVATLLGYPPRWVRDGEH